MVIGGKSVGKSSIVRRINNQDLVDVYIPAYNEEKINSIVIDGQTINFTVIDEPDEDYKQIMFLNFKQCQASIFVIDITNQKSIDELENIYQEIKEKCEIGDKNFSIAVNKSDLRNKNDSQDLISMEKIQEIENKYNCTAMEISATENINIHELLEDIIRKVIKCQSQNAKNDNGKKCIIE